MVYLHLHITYLCILLFTLELLKFYGSHHKDYADCYGRSIAHHVYILHRISVLLYVVGRLCSI